MSDCDFDPKFIFLGENLQLIKHLIFPRNKITSQHKKTTILMPAWVVSSPSMLKIGGKRLWCIRWSFSRLCDDGVVLIDNNQMLLEVPSEAEAVQHPQVFSLSNLQLTLRRSEVVRAKQNFQVETDNLINYPSECSDNRIKKVLQIQFPHHTITLTDLIEINFAPRPLQVPTIDVGSNLHNKEMVVQGVRKDTGKKLVLFRSKQTRDIVQIRGDKKNIAKNVVTAFLNFLRDAKQDGENCEPQMNTLRGLIDRTKFNNQLVTMIIGNEDLRPSFRNFLASSAASWVQNSKLKNKDIHIQALELYQRLCEQRESKRRQSDQKQRERISPQNDENEYLFQSNINHELEDEIREFK